MADQIVHPPAPCCSCPWCYRRRWELQLAARIERELLEAVERDMDRKRLTYLLEEHDQLQTVRREAYDRRHSARWRPERPGDQRYVSFRRQG